MREKKKKGEMFLQMLNKKGRRLKQPQGQSLTPALWLYTYDEDEAKDKLLGLLVGLLPSPLVLGSLSQKLLAARLALRFL